MLKKSSLLPIVLAVAFITFSFTSCYDDTEVWNSIDSLDSRVTALEKKCENMNSDIAALQTLLQALQANVYVVSVKDTDSGYTITFSDGTVATIHDGQKGADGYTPQVSIAQAADGLWYWTLDGEWMLTESGDKVKAVGIDGAKGDTGETGA